MILLDTHVFLWFAAGQGLSSWRIDQFNGAAKRGHLLVSAATAWEIPYLVAKKRIDLSGDPWSWFQATTSRHGIQLLDLTPQIVWMASYLPGSFHRDPADRFLVSTARMLQARLATRDELILAYADDGHVRAIPC